MHKVFEVEIFSENGCTELALPAAPYALLDALSKLELAEGERPGWEILKTPSCHHIYPYLDPAGGTLTELNALTQRLSELGETELSIVEGLIQMEQPRPGSPLLANVYLDIMDEWVAKQWVEKRTRFPYKNAQCRIQRLRKGDILYSWLSCPVRR